VTWVLDCDGVIWLGNRPIAGAAAAVARVRAAGRRVVFLTNNSYTARSEQLEKLARLDMATDPDDLVTSAQAAASLLDPAERALVIGGPGLLEALRDREVDIVRAGSGEPVDEIATVVVGMDPQFDFAMLAAATTALRAGARLVASNDDATFPMSSGLWPGAGSLVAAVATAGGVAPVVAGKPYPPTVQYVLDHLGRPDIVVGDRPATDGRLAVGLGTRFGLVLTGVTPAVHGPIEPVPDLEAADLAALVEAELG